MLLDILHLDAGLLGGGDESPTPLLWKMVKGRN